MDTRNGFIETIGNTPLIRLEAASEATGCEILGKAEFMNPGGSIKDRAAWWMIREAERDGSLQPGGTVVEGTAGNTGIGIAMVPVYFKLGTIYQAHGAFTAAVSPPMAVAVMLGVFWKRFTPTAAFWTMFGGLLVILVSFPLPQLIEPVAMGVEMAVTDTGEPNLWKAYSFQRALFGLLASGVIAIVVTWFTKPKPVSELVGLIAGTQKQARQQFKGCDQPRPCLRRDEDVINKAIFGCFIRIGKFLPVFGNQAFSLCFRVFSHIQIATVKDVDRPFGTHYSNFCHWPGEDLVGMEVFAAHHNIGTAVCLTSHNADLWQSRFGVGIQNFGAMADYTAMFLVHTGQESGRVNKGHKRNIECITQAHKTGDLIGRVYVHYSCKHAGFLGDNAHAETSHSGKPNDRVGCKTRQQIQKGFSINDIVDYLMHAVWGV